MLWISYSEKWWKCQCIGNIICKNINVSGKNNNFSQHVQFNDVSMNDVSMNLLTIASTAVIDGAVQLKNNVDIAGELTIPVSGFKIGKTTNDGNIIVASNNKFKPIAMTGDVVINSSGITSIENSSISNKHIEQWNNAEDSTDNRIDVAKPSWRVMILQST